MSNPIFITLINNIIKSENVLNPKIERKPASQKGDGYIGEKEELIIHGSNKTLNLYIKKAPASEQIRTVINLRRLFIREIYFYEEVIRTYENFQRDKKVEEPFNNILKCYGTITRMDKELLIFDNANLLGWANFPKHLQMNANHVKLIMETYGKFHAISYALKDQRPNVYSEICERLDNDDYFSFTRLFANNYEHIVLRVVDYFDSTKDADLILKFKKYCKDFVKIMEIMPNIIDKHAAITHADAWCSNFMFKYKEDDTENKSPTDALLIDFQLSRAHSPVMDLSFFVYCCCSSEIYNDLELYLKIYYASLSKHMQSLNSDPEVLYPYSVLKEHWKKYCSFGLCNAVFMIKLVLLQPEETFDIGEQLDTKNQTFSKAFDKDHATEAVFQERLKNLIRHFYDQGFFDTYLTKTT